MTARNGRPSREDEAAESPARLTPSIEQSTDLFRRCRACGRPERACDAKHDACGRWCCPSCDHDDDDVDRHAGQVLRDLVRATPTPGPLLLALLGDASDDEGAAP